MLPITASNYLKPISYIFSQIVKGWLNCYTFVPQINRENMKLRMLIATLFLGTILFTSCRESSKEITIREVEVEKEAEEAEGIFERTAKKADEKINKEIEKIGNDN